MGDYVFTRLNDGYGSTVWMVTRGRQPKDLLDRPLVPGGILQDYQHQEERIFSCMFPPFTLDERHPLT